MNIRKVKNGFIVEYGDGTSKDERVFLSGDERVFLSIEEMLEFIRGYYESRKNR